MKSKGNFLEMYLLELLMRICGRFGECYKMSTSSLDFCMTKIQFWHFLNMKLYLQRNLEYFKVVFLNFSKNIYTFFGYYVFHENSIMP